MIKLNIEGTPGRRCKTGGTVNWEAIGAIGEILGAIAVVLTLGYLALQVRFAKASAADANRLTRATGVRDMGMAMAVHDEMRISVAKTTGAMAHYEAFAKEFGVSIEDAGRTDSWNSYWFWLHWGQFRSLQERGDDEELKNIIRVFYPIPAVWYSWNNSPFAKVLLEPAFVEFVEGLVEGTRT
ncbi:MAG: hypothetical protein O2780_12525 [Proteobacteria bacterium]|nr:hypothetical protein [Pseudomonadota bacterium]